ncbi:MAG: hypothetical protein ACFFBP_23845, partial [Promethearchaeota archaeon]
MTDKDLSLFSLSKIATYEVLIEEQTERLDTVRFKYFKRFLSSQKSLKKRFLLSKIFGAIIFGILPIIPLLTYFQVLDFLSTGIFPIEWILFAGSLLFGIFFLFQFFNFFLMAMLNTMKILSGSIFEWFETLPISREKLKKLILLTIIRSLDIPLIVITVSFPIIMFIGTQNIIIFLICIGVSILQTIFSVALLILFSERLNRILNINAVGSKKTHVIRLINLASYIIIVIGSVFLIQWALTSIRTFFILFFQAESPILVVLILSMIPFPIAPGYLLSSFIAPHRIPLTIWYNILIGITLFLILIYMTYQKSIKNLRKSSYSKYKRENAPDSSPIGKLIHIKIQAPTWAHIRKDLIIGSRNLKTFLSLVMPIVIGFIFSFTYYNTRLAGASPFQINFLFNTFVIIGFNLVISGMIIYGLLNIEESGSAILASLPLIPQEQANAKLILMVIIQTLTVLLPPLMYVNTPYFYNSLTTAFWALPFVILFLFLMFELRILFFGKTRNIFLIEEVHPEKKTSKWAAIFLITYLIYSVTLSIAFSFYMSGGLTLFSIFVSIYSIAGFVLLALFFNKIFTIKRTGVRVKVDEFQLEGQATWFTNHPWITSIITVVLNILIFFIITLIPGPYPAYMMSELNYILYLIFYLVAFNLIYILLWIIMPSVLLGVPYGKLKVKDYLRKITL